MVADCFESAARRTGSKEFCVTDLSYPGLFMNESFDEGRCHVQTGSAPQILAGARNLAINWLRNLKVDNIAQALRENG